MDDYIAVSYTHLDVYKRQENRCRIEKMELEGNLFFGQDTRYVGDGNGIVRESYIDR